MKISKKLFKVLLALSLVVITGTLNPIISSAAAPTSEKSYTEFESTTNDPENQIKNIPFDSLPTSLTSSLTNNVFSIESNSLLKSRVDGKDSFEYHFSSSCTLPVYFSGGSYNKVTLSFSTYTWSKSDCFDVELVDSNGNVKGTRPVWKSYGDGVSVYFYLPAGDTYTIKLKNATSGQKIEGIGYWILEVGL